MDLLKTSLLTLLKVPDMVSKLPEQENCKALKSGVLLAANFRSKNSCRPSNLCSIMTKGLIRPARQLLISKETAYRKCLLC